MSNTMLRNVALPVTERATKEAIEMWDATCSLLEDKYGSSVEQRFFYRELFPVGSFERPGHEEDGKPNGLAMEVFRDGRVAHHYLFDDLERLEGLEDNRFVFMSPLGYIGRRRSSQCARTLYAFAVDLDEPDVPTLLSHYPKLGGQSDIGWQAPTYIVNSGTGLHLYYFLKEPIAITPVNTKGLKEFKFALIDTVWNDDTSNLKDKQMQGIYQGFRVVGSASKLGSRFPVTAWHTGPRWTIPELMAGMDIYKQRGLPPLLDKITTPLEEAKEKWPDWYRRRIIDGQETGRWHIKRDLYDWWMRRLLQEGMTYHHRYFCVMALAIYARKCDIDEQEMTRDAYRVWERMKQSPDYRDHPFTEDDLHAALTAWRDQYCTFPRDTIAKMTAKPMTPNRRNYRKQAVHLARARAVQNIDDPEGKWRGRPVGSGTKKQLVHDYVRSHPDASPTQIARELGISRPTVYKYLE